MVITVKLNPRFQFLNSNALRSKADFGTRERRAIIDINIPIGENYIDDGIPIDLSKIRNFIEVYSAVTMVEPLINDSNLKFGILPASDNKASEAKLVIVDTSTGAQIPATAISNFNTTITVEIIGI